MLKWKVGPPSKGRFKKSDPKDGLEDFYSKFQSMTLKTAKPDRVRDGRIKRAVTVTKCKLREERDPEKSRDEVLAELNSLMTSSQELCLNSTDDNETEEMVIQNILVILEYARHARYIYFHDKAVKLRVDFYKAIRKLISTIESARDKKFKDIPGTLSNASRAIFHIETLIQEYTEETEEHLPVSMSTPARQPPTSMLTPDLTPDRDASSRPDLASGGSPISRRKSSEQQGPTLSPIPQELQLPPPPGYQDGSFIIDNDRRGSPSSRRRSPSPIPPPPEFADPSEDTEPSSPEKPLFYLKFDDLKRFGGNLGLDGKPQPYREAVYMDHSKKFYGPPETLPIKTQPLYQAPKRKPKPPVRRSSLENVLDNTPPLTPPVDQEEPVQTGSRSKLKRSSSRSSMQKLDLLPQEPHDTPRAPRVAKLRASSQRAPHPVEQPEVPKPKPKETNI